VGGRKLELTDFGRPRVPGRAEIKASITGTPDLVKIGLRKKQTENLLFNDWTSVENGEFITT
jgi:hypothetical protein